MRTFRLAGIFLTSIVLSTGVVSLVLAADSTVRGTLGRAAPAAGLKNACGSASCIPTIVGGLISIVLGLLGVALVGYVVYAGYLWMTAGGESKQIEEAQTVLRNAVIGVVVVGFSYTIAGVGIRFLNDAFTPTPPVAPPPAATPASPAAPDSDLTPTSGLNPLRQGCRRNTCTSECIQTTCANVTGQRRFTCETSCRNQCEQGCALDNAPDSPSNPSCQPIADYRQCLANCQSDNTERARRGEYATADLQRDVLYACNGDCTHLYCR